MSSKCRSCRMFDAFEDPSGLCASCRIVPDQPKSKGKINKRSEPGKILPLRIKRPKVSPGSIRVGRITYPKRGITHHPSFPGFIPIVVMTASSKYASLSPYLLKNDQGHIMENVWQFSKLYERVPASTQPRSQYQPEIIWQHPAEVHYDKKTQTILPAYWAWRDKGMKNPHPVRYPVGYRERHSNIVGHILDAKHTEPLGYIEARKRIYVPLYRELVRVEKQFQELQDLLKQGCHLLILEVDGPHTESLPYYQDQYQVSKDWIQRDTVLVNQENMTLLLNDPKHPFGHGYALGMELLGLSLDLPKKPKHL